MMVLTMEKRGQMEEIRGAETERKVVEDKCLDDEQIKWINDTIASMTDEEKVGQLFFQLTAGIDEAYLKELMEKYHLGGCRYNNMPSQAVKMQNATLQKYAKIPLLIACNTENGGNGACSDGTPIACTTGPLPMNCYNELPVLKSC